MRLKHYVVLGKLYDVFEVEGCGLLVTAEVLAKMFEVHPTTANAWLEANKVGTRFYVGSEQAGEWVTAHPISSIFEYAIVLVTYGNERALEVLEAGFMDDLNQQLGVN